MARPFISVVIDTYNHERFIEEAISSVVAQDFPKSEREVLVVDDGSNDGTPEVVRKFAPDVRILRKPNGGQASAFNAGIPECRGEIVAFLDGDDWWAEKKLSAVAEAFAARPEVGLVGHSITEVYLDGRRRSELVREEPEFRANTVRGAKTFRLRKSFLGTSRMAFRGELLRRIGAVPEALVIEADEFLFTLGAVYSEVLLLREPLTYYRQHGKNLYQLSEANEPALRKKLGVLLALQEALNERLERDGVERGIIRTILEALEIEAMQVRLALGEGTRLEAVRVELRDYQLHHENASALRKLLKFASVLPGLVLTPAQFAELKKRLTGNAAYQWTRRKVLPMKRPEHVDRVGDWNPR